MGEVRGQAAGGEGALAGASREATMGWGVSEGDGGVGAGGGGHVAVLLAGGELSARPAHDTEV